MIYSAHMKKLLLNPYLYRLYILAKEEYYRILFINYIFIDSEHVHTEMTKITA